MTEHKRIDAHLWEVLQKAREEGRKKENYDSSESRAQLCSKFHDKLLMILMNGSLTLLRPCCLELIASSLQVRIGQDNPIHVTHHAASDEDGAYCLSTQGFAERPGESRNLVTYVWTKRPNFQVERFEKVGLSAAAVNGDTWSSKLAKASCLIYIHLFTLWHHCDLEAWKS